MKHDTDASTHTHAVTAALVVIDETTEGNFGAPSEELALFLRPTHLVLTMLGPTNSSCTQ